MTFLKDEAWQGRVYSGGWVTPEGGDAAVIEPATGAELGRTGIASPADVARATAGRGRAAGLAAVRTPNARCCAGPRIWEANAPEIEQWVIRESGTGTGTRFGGTANLDAFTETRWITIRGDIAPYPF